MGYGAQGHVGWQFQSSGNTSLTTSLWFTPVVNESVVFNEDQIAEAGMYGRLAESPYHRGMQGVTGSITMEANPQAMGFPIRAAFGQCTSTSDTANTAHVFEPKQSDFGDRFAVTPATMEIHRDVGSAGLYFDTLGNQVTLTINNGELVTVGLDVNGAGFSRKAAATPSFLDSPIFRWDQMSATWNGAAIFDIRNLTVTYNNNLEAQHTLINSRAPYRIVRSGLQTVEVAGTVEFAQHSYWDWYLQGSEFPLKLHLAGATPNACTIDMPKIRLTEFSPVISGPGRVEASFSGRAMYHSTSATAIRITLINSQPWYVLGDLA